ncbi:hypothetical protein FWF48_02565 [Candidatus Saccharibacteria bacterium]|nr:hypothetical protein [Candidatus Saccharibacteria bacterium]
MSIIEARTSGTEVDKYEGEKIDTSVKELLHLAEGLVIMKSMLESANDDGFDRIAGERLDFGTLRYPNGPFDQKSDISKLQCEVNRAHEALCNAVGKDRYDSYIPASNEALIKFYKARLGKSFIAQLSK